MPIAEEFEQLVCTTLESLQTRVAALEGEHQQPQQRGTGYVPLLPGETIRVLFVAQHPSIWPSWRSVHCAMLEHPGASATVVLTPFIHGAASQMVTLERMRECLVEEGINFVTAAYLDLDTLQPHVVFLQNPYDETRPPALRSDACIQRGIRVAYIPYGLEVGGGAWNIRAQFDLPVQRNAWRIFARSPRHKKLYARYNAAGNSNVVVTGHPKFDSVPKNIATPLPASITDQFKQRKVVLWTPHFSVTDTPSWSTYRLYADHIFSVFLARSDLFLLLRPHPLFFKSMILNGVWDAQGEAEFRAAIETVDNVALEEGADYHAAFDASCALMTDVGSFLLEYLPTGKPLLYLHHPRGLGMNDEEELTRSLYRADCNEDIDAFVSLIGEGADPKKAAREGVVDEYLSGLQDNIGQRVCDAVVAGLQLGDAPPRLDPSVDKQLIEEASTWPAHAFTAAQDQAYQHNKHQAISAALSQLPPVSSVIDMGCGDGAFTLQLARHAKSVQAYDVKYESLVIAHGAVRAQSVNNITFECADFANTNPLEKFDLVVCLDATRCVIDDSQLLPLLTKLRALAHSNSYLLISERLALSAQQSVRCAADGNVRFRSIDDLRWALDRAGLVIQHETPIAGLEADLTGILFVLRPALLNTRNPTAR